MSHNNQAEQSRQKLHAVPVNTPALLGICASMKPAPGLTNKSAAREFLSQALLDLKSAQQPVGMLCLRRTPLPFFDGRLPEDVSDANVRSVLSHLQNTSRLLFSVPCYWGGVSGVFKNFIDVLCGPLYDMPEGRKTIFHDKPVGIFVVGADAQSSERGAEQASHILSMAGARIVGSPVILANPRNSSTSSAQIIVELTDLGRKLLSC
jgi:NAD(P)H-dependent FMN reductase